MLQIKKLNLTHKKDLRIILNDFNLVLNDGDKAVIIGEEGNGKSTLMKWIYNPSLVENYIEADGERIMGHERLGYLPQEMLDEDKEKTIYEYFSEEEIFWEKTPKELSVIAGKFGMKNDFLNQLRCENINRESYIYFQELANIQLKKKMEKEKVNKLLDHISYEDREKLKQYGEILEEEAFVSEQRAYCQGYVDCIQLLAGLGLLKKSTDMEKIISEMKSN